MSFKIKTQIPYILLTLSIFAHGCFQNQSSNSTDIAAGNLYAQGFEITESNTGFTIKMLSPWMNSFEDSFEYELTRIEPTVKNNTIHRQKIGIPLKRVAIMSTTHLAMIIAIDELPTIVGISEIQYVNNPKFWKHHTLNPVTEIGYENSLDFEATVKLMPDAVFIYGLSSAILQTATRLIKVGIPVIFVSEFNELHPLAKTEWIRYISCFYDKYELADSILNQKEIRYNKAKGIVVNIATKPTVLTGLPWKDIWDTPGARTTTATYIDDAGAQYIFHDMDKKINYQMGIETVFLKAGKADYWINVGISNSKKEILDTDSRFKNFDALNNNKVFNNNKIQNNVGGNDYMESGVMHPDLILMDLISIFHPELLPNYITKYYKKIE
ncbi:MAG: ABC transporter substrate-binding protein [Salinivirgaceae bacterium]|nr:ABC transporter substrate-binding protein [Salinivirgaceae bacterium]MDD4747711.1 ABC transporter substrate-binding protein [Salinivirgaceae bacterium]